MFEGSEAVKVGRRFWMKCGDSLLELETKACSLPALEMSIQQNLFSLFRLQKSDPSPPTPSP